MSAAAQTSEPANPPTGENRLLAVARWLLLLLLTHWIIGRGRQLAAALDQPWGPDDGFLATCFGTTDRTRIHARITRALRRAAALETDLLARRPTEQGFPVEARRAVGAEIIAICRELGIYPGKPARAVRRSVRPLSRFIGEPASLTLVHPRPSPVTPHPLQVATGPPACLAA